MSHQLTAWSVPSAVPAPQPAKRPADAPAPPPWLTNGLLVLASAVLLALACASAWLSYHAQVDYVLAHNGHEPDQAKVWALLLDAGTAGVSLLRLYETLRRRPGVATRISLVVCITASVTMNMLHTPARTPGGYVIAAVPPVMYAAFLEHLLTNLRSLLVADEEWRSAWRTIVLWINFPSLMWSRRRESLRREAEEALTAPELGVTCAGAAPSEAATSAGEVEQGDPDDEPSAERPARGLRRGRGPGPKRVAFEAALTAQVRSGDLRLYSEDERERNAAAYQAAASLSAPLSRGTARRYVVQALPRLEVFRRGG